MARGKNYVSHATNPRPTRGPLHSSFSGCLNLILAAHDGLGAVSSSSVAISTSPAMSRLGLTVWGFRIRVARVLGEVLDS
jgi:hypothetical protein